MARERGREFPADARFSICFFAHSEKYNVDCFKILNHIFSRSSPVFCNFACCTASRVARIRSLA